MKNPLFDTEFLYQLDQYRNRIVYVRILSLTSDNYPIEQIEGVATGGTITVDGSSAVRRVCQLTMTTKNLNINNIYWGLNAKVKIEVGLERKFDYNKDNPDIKYTDYPNIIWFPQGVFLITDFKTSSQVNNYTITLSGKDKMCLLNGDVGGVFNAETDIGTEQYWDEESERYVKEKKTLQYVIREMIHHYAKENFGNIIIKLDPGYDILQNRTGLTLYVIEDRDGKPWDIKTSDNTQNNDKEYYIAGSQQLIDFSNMRNDFIYKFSVDEDNNTLISGQLKSTPTPVVDSEGNYYVIRRILHKDDLGYQIHELDFPDDLIAAAGDTVTSILDKIIERFPAYEYFYNLYGQFVFQPKSTYVNTSWNNTITSENENYILPMAISQKTQYAFEGNQIITAFQNNPKLSEIKNDYTIWGQRSLSSGIQQKIHMRYAIDEKPKYYVNFRKNDDNKQTLFMSQDFYDNIRTKKIIEHEEGWKDKKQKPPSYLLRAQYYSYENYIANPKGNLVPVHYTEDELNARWWNIKDWADYYFEIFGEYPTGQLKSYGITGAIADFSFPNGTKIKANVNRAIDTSVPLMSITFTELDGTTRGLTSGLFIFDVYSDTGNPYLGKISINKYGKKNYSWYAFQHGFQGCGHTYEQFLDRMNGIIDPGMGSDSVAPGVVESWIYNPQIPEEKKIEYLNDLDELDNFYNIKIVDWREIIYQMALDYYAHGHEDKFAIDLFHNNDLDAFGIDRIYDYSGLTKYEQYYHDIEGFWRTLYIPNSEKERYFSLYRKLTGYQHELPASITWNVDENGNYSFIYDEREKNETLVINSLNKNQEEFYIDDSGEIRNYKTDEVLTDDMLEGRAYTLDVLVGRDLAIQQYKEETSVINNTINEKYNEWLELLSHKDEPDYSEEPANELKTQIDVLNEELLIRYDAIQQAQLAVCSYSLFYSCEVNEEDFYSSIEYTPNGYPIYHQYNSKEAALVGEYNKNIVYNPQELLFWFDFYDANSLGLGQLSVPAIGVRPKVESNESVKALIYQDVPDFIFVNEEDYDPTNLAYQDYDVVLLEKDNFLRKAIEEGTIRVSTRSITGQEAIDDMLYKYGYSNEEIQLTSIPVYYLEPNIIISARDEYQLVNGYYILNKMVIPLTYNGTMKNTCIRVPERIY